MKCASVRKECAEIFTHRRAYIKFGKSCAQVYNNKCMCRQHVCAIEILLGVSLLAANIVHFVRLPAGGCRLRCLFVCVYELGKVKLIYSDIPIKPNCISFNWHIVHN